MGIHLISQVQLAMENHALTKKQLPMQKLQTERHLQEKQHQSVE